MNEEQENDTQPVSLSTSKRPRYENKFDLGQATQILALVFGLGGVVLFNRNETEALRAVDLVQAERILVIQQQAAEQKQVSNAKLAEIQSDVKVVDKAIQSVSQQVNLIQQAQIQQGRKP